VVLLRWVQEPLQPTYVSFCAFSFVGLVVDEAAVSGALAVGEGSSTTR
jgi:hypothetical protein